MALLFAEPALADGLDDLRSLLDEEVVTTASADSQKASTAPATSTTVTAEELQTYGIRSLAEAINFLSLGVVTANTLRTPDVGSRGVLIPNDNGKHFLLLVNGHAINDPLFGAARFDQGAGIPIDVIDRIEVIVGPGSVLYGSNAMLGVINVITKQAKDYQGVHALGEYEPGRTVRTGAGAGVVFELFGEPSELTAGAEYFHRFGPDLVFDPLLPARSGGDGQLVSYQRSAPATGIWGGTVENAYFTKAASGLLRFRAGNFEANLLASAYQRGIPYTSDRLNVDFDDPESNELDRALRLDIKHQATISSLVQLSSRVYADTFDYQRRVNRNAVAACFRGDFETCQFYDAGLARWAGIEERLTLNWLGDLSLVTLLGVDARMRWVSAKQEALDFESGEPFVPAAGLIDGSAGVLSPYVQQTWSPNRWFDLNAGVRLDADERFSPIASPRGAIAVSPFEKTTFKAIYSQAFRAPTFHETDSSGFRRARAENLDPEIVRSVEGSVEQRFGTQRVLFGVFRTWWDDLVEPRRLNSAEVAELQARGELPITATNIVQSRNVSSIDNYGYNGSWDGSLLEGRLRYGLNVTAAYTRRSSLEGPQELPIAPQFFGNVHASYSFGGYIPTPAIATYYIAERPVDRVQAFPSERASPLAEVRATLTGPIPGLTGLAYRLSGNVVTASEGAYVAGPGSGRLIPTDQYSAYLGLRYDFAGGGQAATRGEAP